MTDKAVADSTTKSTDSDSSREDVIRFEGPTTLGTIGGDLIQHRTGADIDLVEDRIITLEIGHKVFKWERLTDTQLDKQFIDFINEDVIRGAKPSLRARMPQSFMEGPRQIFFTVIVDDGHGGNEDEYYCIYTMKGLHINKKIPKNKGHRKKTQNFIINFSLEPIEEAG